MYRHGDSTGVMTREDLVLAYRSGETVMDRVALVVHYGGMPWVHGVDPEVSDKVLREYVEEAGGWGLVEERALKHWSDLCISDGIVYTASL